MNDNMIVLATELLKLGIQIAIRAGMSAEDIEAEYQAAKVEFMKRPAQDLPEVE